jgi:hypothetical protein
VVELGVAHPPQDLDLLLAAAVVVLAVAAAGSLLLRRIRVARRSAGVIVDVVESFVVVWGWGWGVVVGEGVVGERVVGERGGRGWLLLVAVVVGLVLMVVLALKNSVVVLLIHGVGS